MKNTEVLSHVPKPIDPTLPDPSHMLEWEQNERLVGFRNNHRTYSTDVFRHGDAYPLKQDGQPLETASYLLNGKRISVPEYLERADVVGMLILKEDSIVYEYYSHGNNHETLWTSRSVGKAIVSTLVGIALNEGRIHSLDDLLTQYKPELAGTAWEGVTLEQLMQHTSGVDWNEDYNDSESDFASLTEIESGDHPYEDLAELVHSLKRKKGVEPGELWSYTTGGAWLLGDILERAVGKPLAHYLEEKIWQPFGMEYDGVWQALLPDKHDMGGHGFNATLRDWGRLGLFILRDGLLPDGRQILPVGWGKRASTWVQAKASITEDYPEGSFGYQWWNKRIPDSKVHENPQLLETSKEAMWALGIFGQLIAVNQKEKIVMIQWSNWEEAEDTGGTLQLEAALLFASVIQALKE